MDRDEFERIKSAEKERLRTKKRLQQTLETLKRRRRVHDAVSAMTRRASDLLDETDALVRTLASDAATSEARLDLALDAVESVESIDLPDEPSDPKLQPSDPDRANDEDDVESRAEQIVQQMKMASGPQHRRSAEARRTTTSQRPSHPAETRRHQRSESPSDAPGDPSNDRSGERAGDRVGDEPGDEPADERPGDTTTTTLPEKTIGRMTESDDDADEATS